MLRKFLISATLLFTASFIAADLNGRWQGTIKTPNGNAFDLTYNFKTEGEKLTGSITSQWGETPIVDGKINGDEFSFTQSFNEMQITHTGKISGDSLLVKIQRGENPALESIFRRASN